MVGTEKLIQSLLIQAERFSICVYTRVAKRIWRTILRKAELEDLTIHDLRRTVGSYMAISGASLPVIGKALGHKDQRSTQIYAHLHLVPVRQAFDDIQGFLY